MITFYFSKTTVYITIRYRILRTMLMTGKTYSISLLSLSYMTLFVQMCVIDVCL